MDAGKLFVHAFQQRESDVKWKRGRADTSLWRDKRTWSPFHEALLVDGARQL
jgi:hypothetical protein